MPPPVVPAGDAHLATTEVASVVAPSLRQRDPPSFSGTGTEDVEDWLASYERVGKFNRWDDAVKLNNVAFYLTDLAKTWFLNREVELVSWTIFRERLRELFGRPASIKADAERKLSQRAQQPNESYTSYIEEVLRLCTKVDPEMSDGEKIKHLVKGIAEDAFQLILIKSPTTVEDLVSFCRNLQEARNSRVRLTTPGVPSGTPLSTSPNTFDDDSLRTFIRQIIREELGRSYGLQTSQPSTACCPANLHGIVREELASALADEPAPLPRPTYADVLRQPVAVPASLPLSTDAPIPVAALYNRPDRAFQPLRSAPVRQVETRTCFYCGIRGHIARFCRRRRRDLEVRPDYYATYHPECPGFATQQMYPNAQDPSSRWHEPRQRGASPLPRHRSTSPRPNRNTHRSPMRSRSPVVPGNQ